MGVIRAWGNFCLNLTILISSCDHGQCDFISYLQFSLVCHSSGEFLLLLLVSCIYTVHKLISS